MPELDSEKPVGDEPPAKAARTVEPSPDGDRRSSSGTDGSLLGGQGGEAQSQPEAEKEDDSFSEASVGGHQVQDHPHEGAVRICLRAQSMFWLPLAPFSRSDNQCSRVPCLPQMVLSLALRWLQTFSCERSASGGSRRASSNRLPKNLF